MADPPPLVSSLYAKLIKPAAASYLMASVLSLTPGMKSGHIPKKYPTIPELTENRILPEKCVNAFKQNQTTQIKGP